MTLSLIFSHLIWNNMKMKYPKNILKNVPIQTHVRTKKKRYSISKYLLFLSVSRRQTYYTSHFAYTELETQYEFVRDMACGDYSIASIDRTSILCRSRRRICCDYTLWTCKHIFPYMCAMQSNSNWNVQPEFSVALPKMQNPPHSVYLHTNIDRKYLGLYGIHM